MIDYLATHNWLFITLVGIFGLLVGSFLNVVIYRLPIMLRKTWHQECINCLKNDKTLFLEIEQYNLTRPASHCPFCNTLLSVWQKIPVLSYLILKGKCASCDTKIPFRYLLVEIITCILSIAVAYLFGLSFQLIAALIITWLLITITFIDLEDHILPDLLTIPLLWLGLLFSCFNLFTNSRDAILGSILGYTFFWTISKAFKLITKKEGIGQGDYKLLAAIGAWTGWQILPFIVLTSSLLGLIIGSLILFFKGLSKRTPIPFGPFIAIAAWISIIWGYDITHAYLHLFGIHWSDV